MATAWSTIHILIFPASSEVANRDPELENDNQVTRDDASRLESNVTELSHANSYNKTSPSEEPPAYSIGSLM